MTPMADPSGFPEVLGDSAAVRQSLAYAARLAPTGLPIILVGATGTGKELYAQAIHRLSGRPGRLVDVNCAAFPSEVADSLLFGHRRGAFTGAYEGVPGLIEDSDGGTLFLDELSSMSLEIQAKLLRVLETNEIRRVGETAKRRVRLRVIAAVQEDFAELVTARLLRFDLIQRLAGATIALPALRDRGDDVLLLALAFAGRSGRTMGPGADHVLRSYSWPGNVRELKMAIARASGLCEGPVLSARDLAESIGLGSTAANPVVAMLSSSGGGSVRDRLVAACEANDWSAVRVARALGMSRTSLFKQLSVHGVSLRIERAAIERRIYRAEGGVGVA